MSHLHLRIVLLGLLVALTFFGAWWMILMVGMFLLLRERAYEVIIIGLLFDLSYAALGTGGFIGVYTLVFVVVGIAGELVRQRLLWRA